jgi:hypothetical protein
LGDWSSQIDEEDEPRRNIRAIEYKRVTIELKSDDIAMRWKANRVCCCVALQKRNREGHTTVRFPVREIVSELWIPFNPTL